MSEDQAQTLARDYARDKSNAIVEIDKLLSGMKLVASDIENRARRRGALELLQAYKRGKPGAIRLVHKLLSTADTSMDALVTNALVERLDDIERIDRLIAIAESRRNASLREIDRRRMVLGEKLRRSVQEIEDAEFEVIETDAIRKGAT